MQEQEILKYVGKRIRSLRELKAISQQEAASLCDFEKSNMSRIEAGRTNPTILTLYKISCALSVSLSELLDIKENR